MDLTADVAVNLVSSLLWVAIGATVYRFAVVPLQRSRTALSRVLRFNRRRPVTICYGIIPPEPGSVYYTVAEGDLAAINHAYGALSTSFAGGGIRVTNAQAVQGGLGELPSVLSISGPRWNRVTELLIGRLGSPLSFNQTEGLIVETPGSDPVEYTTVRRPDGDEQICYGFVCTGEVWTPAGQRQRVAICAGLNTLSTYGAVVFLMALGRMYSLRRFPALRPRRVGSRWAVVLRVHNMANPRTAATVREPLHPDQISVDVVEVLDESRFREPYVYRF